VAAVRAQSSPCKIYDPSPILIDALTVVRMIDILEDWRQHRPGDDVAFFNTISRAVAQKEEHAAKLKDAVRAIWGANTREIGARLRARRSRRACGGALILQLGLIPYTLATTLD
jgi:hypothetical protein